MKDTHLRTKLARTSYKIQLIKSQKISLSLSPNHMRALRVFEDPETGFKANPSGSRDPSNILGGFAAGRGASRIGESVYIV